MFIDPAKLTYNAKREMYETEEIGDFKLKLWVGRDAHCDPQEPGLAYQEYSNFEVGIFKKDRYGTWGQYNPNNGEKLNEYSKYFTKNGLAWNMKKRQVEELYGAIFKINQGKTVVVLNRKGNSFCRGCNDHLPYQPPDGIGDGKSTCFACALHPDRKYKGLPVEERPHWEKIYSNSR